MTGKFLTITITIVKKCKDKNEIHSKSKLSKSSIMYSAIIEVPKVSLIYQHRVTQTTNHILNEMSPNWTYI